MALVLSLHSGQDFYVSDEQVVVGAILGLWLNRRISEKWFSRVVYCVTFLLGWYILYENSKGLLAAMHRPM